MNEHYSLQWFGVKAEGLITVLFVMGLIMHFSDIIYPVGIVAMVFSVVFIAIDIIITLEDKAKRMKRGF